MLIKLRFTKEERKTLQKKANFDAFDRQNSASHPRIERLKHFPFIQVHSERSSQTFIGLPSETISGIRPQLLPDSDVRSLLQS